MRIVLLIAFTLIFHSSFSQKTRFFIRSGDLMENIEGYSMIFHSSLKGNVLGFTEGSFNGETVLFYWTSLQEAFMCSLDPAGGSKTRKPFTCACQSKDEEGIKKMTLKHENVLLVNCKSGNTYMITPEGESLYVK
jgi:hypothetical protein